MKNSQTTKNLNLTDDDMGTPLLDWMMQYGRQLLFGIAGLIVLLLVVIAWSQGMRSESEYLEAASAYNSLEKGNAQVLPKLSSLVNSQTDLQQQYDALIAQTLLSQSSPNEALPFAKRTLARTSADNLPLYNQFAETTLLIATADYLTALKQAELLKAAMLEQINQKSERTFGDSLFAFNLLRIALLKQQIDPKSGAAVWKDWNLYATNDPSIQKQGIDTKVFGKMQNDLRIGNVSLGNYIESKASNSR